MTNYTALGLIFGLFLGLAAAFGGTTEFLLVLVFGAAGLFVGRVLDGEVDLGAYLGKDRQRS